MRGLSKKSWVIIAFITAVVLGFLLIGPNFGKVDDWRYSHRSIEDYFVLGLLVLGVLIVSWFVVSTVLIVKGKPITSSDGTKRMNPKRMLGIFLLAAPIALILLSLLIILAISINYQFLILLLIIPILLLVFIIWGIVYSIKNKIKIAILPLVIILVVIPMLLLIPGGIMIWQLGVFNIGTGSSMGFSTGGAKDINNFRRNVEHNYLPLPTDITYEGLFYDYYFDTGEKEVCQELFCPSYTYAISRDPFSQDEGYYLSVGLNSGIKEGDFKRKKLNLVVVLDISGSMSSSFNRYYYDRFGRTTPIEEEPDEDVGKSKMEVASKSVVGLLDHLNEDDRFGMVLFDSGAYLAKPLRRVGDTKMDAIKGHILELKPRGGTNFEAGYTEGTGLFDEFLDMDQEEYENRIIFLTDAMPNIGTTSEGGLLGLTKKNADNKVYTTFIGIGVDFNTELIEYITKIRGANYYSVHSAKQFKTRMDDEFEYMVTPLVFNLLLKLDAEGYNIEKVYGSPEANEATGEIMKVNTLFPSKKEEEGTKGGLVLLKLKKLSPDAGLKLTVSYENRVGEVGGNEVSVELKEKELDFYENNGIRKGILLSRYADLMKNWIKDEREGYSKKQLVKASVTIEEGIIVPEPVEPKLGRWERQSIPLQVSDDYKKLFVEFIDYFREEMNAMGDTTLSKEVNILKKLSTYNSKD
ncbi:MAG: VWA domain-containing protein [Candidatus Altiarchaeota archaeon]|nr:VWA domain-containing protein [Candidatus Altiarchaeota archaeon]